METVPAAPGENSSSSSRTNIIKNEEGSSRQEGGRSSPPPNCAICLGRCRNKSFTDSCLHQFCFKCLVTWSKVKTECPLCKQTFKSIIHNVKSNHQYEEYQVEQRMPEDILGSIDLRGIVAATRRYRFRATLTMPRVDSMAFHRFLMSYPISTIVREGFPSELGSHRRSRLSPTAFRRTIYRHNLWARPLPDFTGRFRDCTPEFYRYNDSQIHRLIPWLNRELHYLLNDNAGHIAYVLARIVELLPQCSINSTEFRDAMQRYFGDRTQHFLHELYCFASTPYDLTGYDRNIQYTSDPHAEVNQVISGSESDDSVDSDIVMVSSSHASSAPSTSTSAAPAAPAAAAAGPSRPPQPSYLPYGADPSVIPIETISHSDTDDDSSEVMVVGYIKPPHQRTPEVVDLLASDSDVVLQETMPEPIPPTAPVPVPDPDPNVTVPDPDVAVDLTSMQVPPPQPLPQSSSNMVKLKVSRPRPPPSDSDSDETYTPSPPPPHRRRRARPESKKASRKDRNRSTDDGRTNGVRSEKRKSRNGRNVKSWKREPTDDERSEESSGERGEPGPSHRAAPGPSHRTAPSRKRSSSSRGESPDRKRLRSVVVKSTSKPQPVWSRSRGSFSVWSHSRGSFVSRPSLSSSSSSEAESGAAPRPRRPDESAPDESVPDESVPDESVPHESVPHESVPRFRKMSIPSSFSDTGLSASDSDDYPLNLTYYRLRKLRERTDNSL